MHLSTCWRCGACEGRRSAYLYKVDESGENGTAEHVVLLRLLPEERQVLHQTASVGSDLQQINTQGQKVICSDTDMQH